MLTIILVTGLIGAALLVAIGIAALVRRKVESAPTPEVAYFEALLTNTSSSVRRNGMGPGPARGFTPSPSEFARDWFAGLGFYCAHGGTADDWNALPHTDRDLWREAAARYCAERNEDDLRFAPLVGVAAALEPAGGESK